MENEERVREPSGFAVYLPATIILIVVGWGGVIYLLSNTLPTLGPRWLFFFFLVLASTGTAFPLVYLVNRQFSVEDKLPENTIIRESLLVGLYIPTLAWLQLGRILTLVLALGLAVALLLIDFLFRLRDKADKRETN